ncbi:MAG: hypothetical protein GY859_33390 [Desulfobacterales bacterium]|nr:hypothetical protein [Desulfobacterales bacterium]
MTPGPDKFYSHFHHGGGSPFHGEALAPNTPRGRRGGGEDRIQDMREKSQKSAEERYSIEFRGRAPGGGERAVDGLAALFRCEKEKIRGLFNGKTHVLKKNLGWEHALKYYNILAQKGAACHIRVMMDPASFRSALTPSPPAPPPAPKEKTEEALTVEDFQTFHFDRARVVPTLCHPSYKEPVFDHEKKIAGFLISTRFAISRIAALFIAIFASLALEVLFADYYARNIDGGVTGSYLSVLLFVSGLIIFPILARPLRKVRITRAGDGDQAALNCNQTGRIQYFRSRFIVRDNTGAAVCEMVRNNVLHRYVCRGAAGEILFTAEEEPDVSEIVLTAADDLRDEVVDFQIFQKTVMAAAGLLKKKRLKKFIPPFFSIIRGRPGGGKGKKKKKGKSKQVYVIRNGEKKAIGHFSLDRISALTLYRRKNQMEESDRGVLFAFCLLLAGL